MRDTTMVLFLQHFTIILYVLTITFYHYINDVYLTDFSPATGLLGLTARLMLRAAAAYFIIETRVLKISCGLLTYKLRNLSTLRYNIAMD